MGKTLAVYTDRAYKEYILPSVNNSDYSITLHRDLFGLSRDVELKMEVMEKQWRILASPVYTLLQGDKRFDRDLQNGDLLKLHLQGKRKASIIVKDSAHIVKAYEKFDIRKAGRITIGMGKENDICYSFYKFVSQKHAVLIKEQGGWFIEDLGGVNGVFVNSVRIQGKQKLVFGDNINIMGLHLVFLGKILAVDTTDVDIAVNTKVLRACTKETFSETVALMEKREKKLFHRSPRSIQKIETEPITVEQPPAPEKPEDLPLFMAIGPSLTMAFPMLLSCAMMILSSRSSGYSSGIYMYTGLIMAVSSAAIAIFWTVHNQKFHKKKLKEKELLRFDKYSEYLVKKTDEIKEKYEHNMEAMKKRYLPADECVTYSEGTELLWNRNAYHKDFMCHRLGLGDMPFQAPIKVAEERFSMLEDSLSNKPGFIYENYKTLFQVPIAIEMMQNRLIGIVGGEGKKGAIHVARLLSAQIAANNCYTDIKLAYIYDESSSLDKGQWEFARWFPHVWSEDRKVRFVGANKPEIVDLFYEMAKIFRHREETAERMEGKIYKPHYVLFVSNPEMLDGEIISKYIFEEKKNYGLTTVLLVERREELPNSCHFVIENTDGFQGIYDTMQGEDERLAIQFDTLEEGELCRFARRLSDIEVQEVEEGGELPASLSFFDMYHVDKLEDFNVLERWKKNRTYDNIKGLIGERAGGKPCYLDVHEKFHGPHGLVAGTTGSGKSETLQTYMLSLALNYSPDDVGYFVIDYKGGGMANLFNGLPHLIGQISNLSENQVHRAMVSIKSENRHRQQIFNENGVNNINAYTRLYKNGEASQPVPHLFIIIDEFAELKREEPDFMRELISVAQVGRSLGVHLILATQKPSGTVDDNIWSNSKFRLCLRVQDKQDSNDMLHKPDAAYITQAGRCYLQVGNDEVFELFQSGFSGAPYIASAGGGKTDTVRLLSGTGKVEMMGGYTKGLLKRKMQYKWIYTLEAVLNTTLKSMKHPLEIILKDETSENEWLDKVFRELERQEIEYPRNAYNERCMVDFAQVYIQAKKMSGDVARNVLAIAKQASVKLPQEREYTQLDAIKEYLAEVAEKNGYVHDLQLWLPVLPQHIYMEEFEEFGQRRFNGSEWKRMGASWNMRVLMGKADDPQNQAQMPLYVDIAESGHLAVCGSVTSGKSTFLQSFVYGLINRYSPQCVNVYALDFSSKMMSAFEEAPHVGGVMYEGDMEKIAKFFNMIGRILEERKQIFHGGNYSQYVKANGIKFPAIFVVIDNVSAFVEKTEEAYLDNLIQLSKEGVSHGIYLVMAAGGFGHNEIPNRVAENVMNVLTLQLTDKFAYGDVLRTMDFDVIPETGVKGRGLAFCEGRVLEFQTLLSIEAEDDYKRMEKIEEVCGKMRAAWPGKMARSIPQIPKKPVWSDFVKLEDVETSLAEPDRIPVGYNAENASVYSIDLRNLYCYLITGDRRTGRTNYMRVLIEAVQRKKSNICIIDTPGRKLRTYANRQDLTYVNSDEQIFAWFQKLIPEIKRRNEIKNEMVNKDYEESEMYQRMSKEIPYFIFITDMAWFIRMIQDSDYKMEGFLQNILDKGRLHNIYFFGSLCLENRAEVAGTSLFNLFTTDRRGIHFGGNAAANPVFNFDYLSYREQSETQKPGVGMLPGPLYEGEAEKVVVPLVRGKKND